MLDRNVAGRTMKFIAAITISWRRMINARPHEVAAKAAASSEAARSTESTPRMPP